MILNPELLCIFVIGWIECRICMSKCIMLKYYNKWNALVYTEKGMYSVLLEDYKICS